VNWPTMGSMSRMQQKETPTQQRRPQDGSKEYTGNGSSINYSG
jgi:hypothetical protein